MFRIFSTFCFVFVFGLTFPSAQVRDLFAEFEEEVEKADASAEASQKTPAEVPNKTPAEEKPAKALEASTKAPETSNKTPEASTKAPEAPSKESANKTPAAEEKAPETSNKTPAPIETPAEKSPQKETPSKELSSQEVKKEAEANATLTPEKKETLPDSSNKENPSDNSQTEISPAKAPLDSSAIDSSNALEADEAKASPAEENAPEGDSAQVIVQDSTLSDSSVSKEEAKENPSDEKSQEQNAKPEEEKKATPEISRRDILGPTKVSKVYGMNDLKGKYKSPRKALFMSLVVPGSGQLYVGGSSFTNVRGGVYLALEAGLWGGWYYYSVKKYDRQVARYKKFARDNFSIGRYEQKMHDIFYTLDGTDEESNFRMRYMGGRETYCESIYGTATANGCYDREKTFASDANHTGRFDTDKTLGEELKKIKLYDAGDLYQQIAGDSYVLGWLDVENETLSSELNLEDVKAETVALGKSKAQKTYRSMRAKANDYANLQAWFFGGILLNHLVSALDAALTANAHNKALYEEKVSLWERVRLEGYIVPIQGARATVLNARWSF